VKSQEDITAALSALATSEGPEMRLVKVYTWRAQILVNGQCFSLSFIIFLYLSFIFIDVIIFYSFYVFITHHYLSFIFIHQC